MHPATAQSPTETIPAQPVLTARESEDGHHFELIEYARVALVAALAIREYFTALIILLFVLVAEMLEELTVGRGRRAIQTLLDLMPKQATVLQMHHVPLLLEFAHIGYAIEMGLLLTSQVVRF